MGTFFQATRLATSITLSLALFNTASPALTPRPEAPPPGLNDYLKEQMEQRHIPGMQVAVVQHGKIVLAKAFGQANVEDRASVTDDTVFQTNSITKAFTGVAIMQLVESGKLDLAAAVSHYLDGLPTAWQSVTIEQLATHTSGLPEIMDSASARLIVDGDAQASWEKVQSLPMEFPSGERFSYNQTNYLLLGKIIDKLAGEPFTQFVKERQLNVVGMSHTVYGDDRDVLLNSAETYTFMHVCHKQQQSDELCRVHLEFPDFLRTGAGLNSTAQDLARWIIALQNGDLLKKESLTSLWTPLKLNDGKAGPWAIGWPVTQRPQHRVYMARGGGKSAIGVYPDDDLAVVILTNLSWNEPVDLVDTVAARYFSEAHATRSHLVELKSTR